MLIENRRMSTDTQSGMEVEMQRLNAENLYLWQRIQDLHDYLEDCKCERKEERDPRLFLPSWLGRVVPVRPRIKIKESNASFN